MVLMEFFFIKELSKNKNTLAYIGSVDNVIAGIIPEELKNRRFNASKVKFGFELGSPQGIYNMGECIVMNSLIYSSRTDKTRKERDPLMWGPEFVTSGIFLVPSNCEANLEISYCSLDNILKLKDIYSQIYDKVRKPFFIAGCVEFDLLRSHSITYSPIEKENIFTNEKKYFTEDEHKDRNMNIAFNGVVSDMTNIVESEINKKLKTVLYYNPYNKQNDELISHTHAAILNSPIVEISEVKPNNVKDVIHIMDDSLLRYIKAKIFCIDDIIEYKEEQ